MTTAPPDAPPPAHTRTPGTTQWLLLGGAVVTEVAASLTLKAALHHALLYVVVAVGYVAAFTFLAFGLRRGLPLGTAYGIWGALGVAGTAILSALIYHEAITGLMVLGIALAIVGVLVVEVGSQQAHAASAPRADGGRD